jgi:hypothetical protein
MYVDLESRTGNEDARRYLAIWSGLPAKERIGHMPEQICELANVAPMDLIGWVSRQVFAEGTAKSNMCLSFMRDKVLEKSAQFAMASPDNFKHAELFMKAGGLITSGSGNRAAAPFAPVSIYNVPVATATSMAAAKSTSNGGFKSMDEQIVELSRIMQAGATDCMAERIVDNDDDDDDEGDEDEPSDE